VAELSGSITALSGPLMGLVVACVLGAIPFGVIWSLVIAGVDPRKAGSKNIGFTNVLRVSSKPAAILTLLSDAGKGAAAVWVMRLITADQPGWDWLAALAATASHMFTPLLRFKGGKGVATAFGAILMAMPLAAMIIFLTWCVVLVVSSYVSLASIVAGLVLPVAIMLFTSNLIAILSGTVITTLIIIRHAENIQRLRAGVEHSIRGP
jgi:acyl phosphate:glycerol-3-phosphate acyltransferase